MRRTPDTRITYLTLHLSTLLRHCLSNYSRLDQSQACLLPLCSCSIPLSPVTLVSLFCSLHLWLFRHGAPYLQRYLQRVYKGYD